MQRRSRFLHAAVLLMASTISHTVRADQVVLTDISWSHPTDAASESRYHVNLAAGAPTNWTSPVDYTQGSFYFALDVKTKPAGDAPTKFQVCLESATNYACADQSPVYTKTGHYTWTGQFSTMWYSGDMDWTKGVSTLGLTIKDDMNNKPAGDPKYVPTNLHVTVVLLSKGATYDPTMTAGSGAMAAGTGGKPMNTAGSAGDPGKPAMMGTAGRAGSSGRPAADGGHAAPSAGSGAAGQASDPTQDSSAGSLNTPSNPDAGAAGSSSASQGSAGSGTHVMPRPGSNCSAAPGQGGNGWLLGVGAAVWLARRRRARR